MRRVSFAWMLLYGAARGGIGVHDIFFNAVAGFYLSGYGLSNAVIGFLANERSFVGSFLQPVTGALSDRARTRWGRRKPFMLLLLPVAVGFLLLMAHPPTPIVVAVFVLGPLLLGMGVIAYEVLLPDTVVEEQRGLANGVNRALGFVGGIIFLILAAQAWQSQQWLVFLFVAAALTLGLAVTLFGVREPPPPVTLANMPLRWRPSQYLSSVFQYRDATIYILAYFFFWLGLGGITPFVTRFANEDLDVPQNETFILLLAAMVSTLVAAVPAGWLGDRLGKKLVMSWGLALFSVFVLAGSQAQDMQQVVVLLVLVGLAQAVPTALAYPLFTELIPARRMGELTGLSTMIWSLAQPLGATFFGFLADMTGTLRTVLVCGGLALAVSWALLLKIRAVPVREPVAEAP